MLTPLVAVSNTDVSFHGQQARNMQNLQEQAGTPARQPESVGATASVSPRINILSLTGQLQYAQSISVLAETLGNIVNMPRRPGESPEDHIERLIERIRALPPAERRVVEAQLNLLVQGATLKALAEALKNPSGPEAARLAVMLEISRYKERDLVARAVVTSYRQNSGSDLPAANTGQPVRNGQPPANPAAPATAAPRRETTETSAARATPEAPAPSLPASPKGQTAMEPLADASPLAAARRIAASVREGTQSEQADTGAGRIAAREEQAEGKAIRTAGAEDMRTAVRSREGSAGQTHTQHVESGRNTRMVNEAGASLHPLQEEDMSARRSGRLAHDPKAAVALQMPAPATTDAAKAAMTKTDALANFLLAVLGPAKPQAGVGTAQTPLPEEAAFTAQQAEQADGEMPGAGIPRSTAGGSDAERLAAADARAAQTAARNETMQNMAMRPEQQGMPASVLIAAALGREAVGLPYVSYPLAKDEPESPTRHRGGAPSSGGEEEQQASDSEQQDEETPQEPGDETAGADEDATGQQEAQDFYQRMSAW